MFGRSIVLMSWLITPSAGGLYAHMDTTRLRLSPAPTTLGLGATARF